MENHEILNPGDKVEIKRGKLKGHVFTVDQSCNDWATMSELYDAKRVQGKRNLKLVSRAFVITHDGKQPAGV